MSILDVTHMIKCTRLSPLSEESLGTRLLDNCVGVFFHYHYITQVSEVILPHTLTTVLQPWWPNHFGDMMSDYAADICSSNLTLECKVYCFRWVTNSSNHIIKYGQLRFCIHHFCPSIPTLQCVLAEYIDSHCKVRMLGWQCACV